jgi:hypothetical protein
MVPLMGGAMAAAPASAAPDCQPSTIVEYAPHPGAIVVQTSFENGDLDQFIPTTSGKGVVAVSTAQHRSGACSAYLHATADAGSVASMSTPSLPPRANEIYADGWFNITQAGLPDNDVPYLRFFNGSDRVMDVFRDNKDGQLWLRVASPSGSFVYTRLGRVAELEAWHHLVVHVVANGSASTVEVWFNDQLLYSSNEVSAGHNALTTVQLGAEHPRQMGDSYVDDIAITAR